MACVRCIISTLKHQYQFPLDISPSESVCPSRSYPLTFFTFYRPKSDVENIVEDNDKDDDIDEFDEDDDDQSYEGKDVFNRQCLASDNERN